MTIIIMFLKFNWDIISNRKTMKLLRLLPFTLPFLLLFSCSKNDVTPPPYTYDVNLENTVPIPDTVMRHLEGIYSLTVGSEKLGSAFVCKVSKRSVSFFSDKAGRFIVLKYGFNPTNSSIQFA